MAKWLDKYEDGGEFLGTTNKGFDYNGAWGGTMQMGGGIPGAVGFTYARVAGAAPSNGKYAKKTKASAQDGTNVKKPLVKLSADELKMQRLKQYAQQQSRKEQPTVQSRGSVPDDFRKQLYEDAQNAGLRKQLLKGIDVATDIMQVGNFVPHPIGQAIGKAGNAAGAWVDAAQAASDVYSGNYGSAAINAISIGVPVALGSNTFRRNSKYLQPGQPLYSLSPQAGILPGGYSRTRYIEPFTNVRGMTDKNLLANRALLGVLGAETAYDSYQNGGEMRYYQEGLDFKPKTISKQGSKIKKDDNGYWNPENWGEPVEIDSNQITMDGVYEPLLGISDTGDTQMMYPGEDYEFDGESVIEYPMNNIPKAQFGTPITFVDKVPKVISYLQDFFSPAHSYGNINQPKKEEKVVERKPHEVMNSLYADAIGEHFKTYNPSNVLKQRGKNDTATVNMSTDRFNTAKVPEYVIDAAIESSKKNNYPVGKLLALMGRESTFGVGDKFSRSRKDDKKGLVSGWNVDQDYTPYNINRFLADNRVPGIRTEETAHGWEYYVDDEKASQDYIDKHPKLLEKYKKKLESRKSIAGKDAFDLAIEWMKKSGVKEYNPGDKSYEADYNKDYQSLRKDPTLQKYLKNKGVAFDNGGWLEKYK